MIHMEKIVEVYVLIVLQYKIFIFPFNDIEKEIINLFGIPPSGRKDISDIKQILLTKKNT